MIFHTRLALLVLVTCACLNGAAKNPAPAPINVKTASAAVAASATAQNNQADLKKACATARLASYHDVEVTRENGMLLHNFDNIPVCDCPPFVSQKYCPTYGCGFICNRTKNCSISYSLNTCPTVQERFKLLNEQFQKLKLVVPRQSLPTWCPCRQETGCIECYEQRPDLVIPKKFSSSALQREPSLERYTAYFNLQFSTSVHYPDSQKRCDVQ